MECDELAANLTDFLEGEMDDAFELAAVEHLATCAQCDAVLAGTRSVIGFAPAAGRIEVPADIRASLLSAVVVGLQEQSGERQGRTGGGVDRHDDEQPDEPSLQ